MTPISPSCLMWNSITVRSPLPLDECQIIRKKMANSLALNLVAHDRRRHVETQSSMQKDKRRAKIRGSSARSGVLGGETEIHTTKCVE